MLKYLRQRLVLQTDIFAGTWRLYIGLPILGNRNSFKSDRKYTGREGGGGGEIETHSEKYTGHSQRFVAFTPYMKEDKTIQSICTTKIQQYIQKCFSI